MSFPSPPSEDGGPVHGERLSSEFTVARLRSPDGELTGIAALVRNVTARWQCEALLRRGSRPLSGCLISRYQVLGGHPAFQAILAANVHPLIALPPEYRHLSRCG